MGQEDLLQSVGEVVFGVVEAGAVQGLGDQARQGGEDGTFVGGEVMRMVIRDGAAADGPPGTVLAVSVRGRTQPATVTALPFVSHRYVRNSK